MGNYQEKLTDYILVPDDSCKKYLEKKGFEKKF